MAKLDVNVLKGVNGINFGDAPDSIHKQFGNNYKKNESSGMSQSDLEYLNRIDELLAKMTGRPKEVYSKYNGEEYDPDGSCQSNYYPFCRIDYDENDKFEAIEIYSDQGTTLTVDGKDFSSFKLKDLLTLADDFVIEENNTSYTSYTKQISIWCPDGDSRVETILFGKPDYYNE